MEELRKEFDAEKKKKQENHVKSIDEMLDEDRQDEIYEYFMETDTDKISVALDEFEDEYSLDTISADVEVRVVLSK